MANFIIFNLFLLNNFKSNLLKKEEIENDEELLELTVLSLNSESSDKLLILLLSLNKNFLFKLWIILLILLSFYSILLFFLKFSFNFMY